MMDLSFPKKEKLKSKKLIDQLFDEGKHVTCFPLKLIYCKCLFDDDTLVKTMVVVPKKNFKGAVERNRIKRLLREAYRLNKHRIFNNIEGNFTFAILYLGKEMPNYRLLEKKIIMILEKFLKNTTHEHFQ